MTTPTSVHSCYNIVSRICPTSTISDHFEKTHRHERFSSPSNSMIHYQSCKSPLIDVMICWISVFQQLCMRTLGILDQIWLKAEKFYCRLPAYFLFILLKPARSRETKSKLVLTDSGQAWTLEVMQSFCWSKRSKHKGCALVWCKHWPIWRTSRGKHFVQFRSVYTPGM